MDLLAQEKTGFRAGFDSALEEAALLLPKIGYFLLILIVGYFVAKFVAKILTKVLQRVGFDQLVERGGVKRAMAKSKYDAADILGKIVFYFIFLLVLSAAFGVFGPDNPVSAFLREIIAFLPNLFVAVLVLVLAAAIAAAIKELLGNMLGGLSYGNALANAASLAVIAIGVFFALDQLQIAPLIVGGIFYALLALIIIPPIIAFGVGGIDPARETIVNMRDKAKDKKAEIQDHVESQSSDDEPPVETAAAPARRTRATSTRATTRARAHRADVADPAAPPHRLTVSSTEGQGGSGRPALLAARDHAPERAAGRLLVALAGALALVLAAVPLALLVRAAWPPLADADAALTRGAEDAVSGSATLLTVARATTLAGDPVLLWLLVLVVCVILYRRGDRRLVLFLLAVRVGAQLLSTGLKLAVDRARPVFDEPVDTALGASFPSGHSLGAAAVWTALAVVVLPLVRRGLLVLLAAVALAVAVATSRVLLGVHFLTDVVGGVLLGFGWTAVCAAVFVAWRLDEGRQVDQVHEGVEPA